MTTGSGNTSVTGSNTGDQTIALSGAVTGSGTGSFSTTLSTDAVASANIVDATILAADLAANSVTTDKIVDLTIVNADIAANAAIVDTKLATISTALKVSNSATTAIASNTANAIVARDDFGNFTAGTITAALSGNVTGNVLGNVTGDLTGNASTATSATTSTNLAGGSAGALAYQTAAGTTTFTAAGTSGQVLKSTGGSAPAWTTLSTSDLTGTYNLTNATGILASANGGTGVDNTDKTITLGGDLTTGAGITSVAGSNTGDNSVNSLYSGLVSNATHNGDVSGSTELTIGDSKITSAKIAADAITSFKILDATIVNADIATDAAIADTKLAMISTALKVSNSATTAIASNTANAIVARDGSGNFTAGTITAALSGNVTGNVLGNVTGDLTGNASTATSATTSTNLAGGSAGAVTYQSAVGTTSFSSVGTTGQVLKSNGSSAPTWTSLSLTDITSGTISLTSQVSGVLPGANGGTGVANTGKIITLGGNLTTAGNFSTILNVGGNTSVILPLSGNLSTLAGTETLTNKTITDGIANTQSSSDNSTKIATTAFVKTAISDATNEVDDEFSANYNQTEFTLTQLPAQNSKVRMYVNGSKISGAAYSVNGSKVTYVKSKNNNNNLNDARVQFEYYY